MSARNKLSESEIEYILKDIPYPPGVGKSAREAARSHLIEMIRSALRELKRIPEPEALETFKAMLIEIIYLSFIQEGENVGTSSATSLAAPMTQFTLNTFHFVGVQSGNAITFQKIRSYMTGSKKNKEPQMNIYFRHIGMVDDLHEVFHYGTYEFILSLRGEFEQTTIKDLALSTEILEGNKIPGLRETIELHASIYKNKFIGWEERFKANRVLVITLDTYRMFTHRISMEMIAKAIEGPDDKTDALACVWKSQLSGEIYVLVDESLSFHRPYLQQVDAILHFLHLYVKGQFPKWIVSGIKDIISIEPIRVDIMKGIEKIEKESQDIYRIYTSNYKTRWLGISLGDLMKLANAANLEILFSDERKLPSREEKKGLYIRVKYQGKNLLTYLKDAVKRVRDLYDKKEKMTEDDLELYEASQFYYMQTSGANMDEIIWRDDVDLYRCTSNHSHEIFEMRGIDATKFYLTMRFQQTLEGVGTYVNKCHTAIVFDLLSSLGSLGSLSFAGLIRRGVPVLSLASHERAHDVFGNSATFGEKESIQGVSEAMYTGGFSKNSGTGSVFIRENFETLKYRQASIPLAEEAEGDVDLENLLEDTKASEKWNDLEQSVVLTNVAKMKIENLRRLILKPETGVVVTTVKGTQAIVQDILQVHSISSLKGIALKFNTSGMPLASSLTSFSPTEVAMSPEIPQRILDLGLPIPPRRGYQVPLLPPLVLSQIEKPQLPSPSSFLIDVDKFKKKMIK